MVIIDSQQWTFWRYTAKVLLPIFIFCSFRCVIRPLTGVINYVFAFVTHSEQTKTLKLIIKNSGTVTYQWGPQSRDTATPSLRHFYS